MATVNIPIRPSTRTGLVSTPGAAGEQKTSAVVIRGNPIRIDSTGYLIASGTASGSSSALVVNTVSSGQIAGFLQKGMTSTSTAVVEYVVAQEGMVFEGTLVNDTSASSAAVAQTDIGAGMGLALISGDTLYGVNKGEGSSTLQCVLIVGLIDPIGTANGRVQFVINEGWRQRSG